MRWICTKNIFSSYPRICDREMDCMRNVYLFFWNQTKLCAGCAQRDKTKGCAILLGKNVIFFFFWNNKVVHWICTKKCLETKVHRIVRIEMSADFDKFLALDSFFLKSHSSFVCAVTHTYAEQCRF